MPKKIDAALTELVHTLKHHAKISGARPVSLKKYERATLKVYDAAAAYATAVENKTGIDSVFLALKLPTLDTETVQSLKAERDSLAKQATGQIPTQPTAA